MPLYRVLFGLTAISLVACTTLLAQEGELQSILIGGNDDLRPLIDLDVQSSPAPSLDSPVLSKTDKPKLESIATPSPIPAVAPTAPQSAAPQPAVPQPAVLQPAVRQPAVFQPAALQPVAPRGNAPRVSQAAGSATNLFEFGIAGRETEQGVLVRGVFVNSPAQQTTILPGDVITALNGQPTRSLQTIEDMAKSNGIQSVKVLRKGRVEELRPQSRVSPSRPAQPQSVLSSRPITPPAAGLAGPQLLPATGQPLAPNQPGRVGQYNIAPRRMVAQPASASAQQTWTRRPSGVPSPTPSNSALAIPGRAAASLQGVASTVTDSTPPQPVPPTPRPAVVVQRPIPQQQPVSPRFGTPARPLMGQGGRLIGNGRLINSAARLLPVNW